MYGSVFGYNGRVATYDDLVPYQVQGRTYYHFQVEFVAKLTSKVKPVVLYLFPGSQVRRAPGVC